MKYWAEIYWELTAPKNNPPKHFADKSYPIIRTKISQHSKNNLWLSTSCWSWGLSFQRQKYPDLKLAWNSESVHKGLACLNDSATTLIYSLGENFVHHSIIGSKFVGKLLRIGQPINGHQTVMPEIRGSAYITGYNTLVIDKEDPLPNGFTLSDIWS